MNLKEFCLRRKEQLSKSSIRSFQDKLFLEIVNKFEEYFPNNSDWNQLDLFWSRTTEPHLYILNSHHYRCTSPRYVPYQERLPLIGVNTDTYEYVNSQGMTEVMTWKGEPLFKTTTDFAIYQMLLWELKPKTIIEIGSGNGSSARFFRDTMKSYGLNSKIITIDYKNKDYAEEDITFINADCMDLGTIRKNEDLYKNIAHPCLIVEDADANIKEILDYFYGFTVSGDYIVVEDIDAKVKVYHEWVQDKDVLVDTKYTDYFGINYCSFKNSVLKRKV